MPKGVHICLVKSNQIGFNKIHNFIVSNKEGNPLSLPCLTKDYDEDYSYILALSSKEELLGLIPFRIRGNFPCPGFTYDPENDVFYAPQPFNSWILNPTTYVWAAPIVQPTRNDDDDFDWAWDESVYQGDNSKGWVKDFGG